MSDQSPGGRISPFGRLYYALGSNKCAILSYSCKGHHTGGKLSEPRVISGNFNFLPMIYSPFSTQIFIERFVGQPVGKLN